ncbi:MAG: TnpV protein [Bacilli bacterium]
MTIKYTKAGEYYFPNLKQDKQLIKLSKYGRMKLKYLKEQQKGLYFKLLSTNELKGYLQAIDKEAIEIYNILIELYKQKWNVTEILKQDNQMKWFQLMNYIDLEIERFIIKEFIFK